MTMCISLKTPIPTFYLFVSQKTKHYSPKYMPSLILCIVFFFQIFNEVLQYLNVQETCKKDWHCFHKDCWFSNTVHRKLHRKILRILRVIPHCRSAVLPLSSASYLMVLSSYWHFLLVSGNLENLKKKCLNSLEEVTIEKNKYYWIKATYE